MVSPSQKNIIDTIQLFELNPEIHQKSLKVVDVVFHWKGWKVTIFSDISDLDKSSAVGKKNLATKRSSIISPTDAQSPKPSLGTKKSSMSVSDTASPKVSVATKDTPTSSTASSPMALSMAKKQSSGVSLTDTPHQSPLTSPRMSPQKVKEHLKEMMGKQFFEKLSKLIPQGKDAKKEVKNAELMIEIAKKQYPLKVTIEQDASFPRPEMYRKAIREIFYTVAARPSSAKKAASLQKPTHAHKKSSDDLATLKKQNYATDLKVFDAKGKTPLMTPKTSPKSSLNPQPASPMGSQSPKHAASKSNESLKPDGSKILHTRGPSTMKNLEIPSSDEIILSPASPSSQAPLISKHSRMSSSLKPFTASNTPSTPKQSTPAVSSQSTFKKMKEKNPMLYLELKRYSEFLHSSESITAKEEIEEILESSAKGENIQEKFASFYQKFVKGGARTSSFLANDEDVKINLSSELFKKLDDHAVTADKFYQKTHSKKKLSAEELKEQDALNTTAVRLLERVSIELHKLIKDNIIHPFERTLISREKLDDILK